VASCRLWSTVRALNRLLKKCFEGVILSKAIADSGLAGKNLSADIKTLERFFVVFGSSE